jgi:hypothetical protein
MNAQLRRILFLFLFPLGLHSQTVAEGKVGSRLEALLSRSAPTDQIMAWVTFSDKGGGEALRYAVPQSVVSPRSLQRRRKVRAIHTLVDYADLPVDQSYCDQVAAHVLRVRHVSKWLNSVSVVATPAQIQDLTSLAIVNNIDLVSRFAKRRSEDEQPAQGENGRQTGNLPAGITSLDYGTSLTQVSQINVPAIHDLGNHAEGVVVGVFDNGFRLLTHQAFDSLHIIATYDFVDHKVSVVPNNTSTSFGSHGVNTLSTIGGYKSGQLIGPAFKADFILARTENDSSETPIEEDNWVAAIEWADSIGVDVTSTSLGYLTFDSPYTSLTWQDMNGNTAPMTRAADMAVARGILVVNSAGNDGSNASHNTLGAPADGDSVMTIGAVDASGVRSSFSSVGPTTSVPARIKPDVMAMGSAVKVASASNPSGYGTSSGTSFSCPLAAGAAALMVKAWPSASPLQIMDAMRSSASRSGTPDNQYGYGIINTLAAMQPRVPTLAFPAQAATGQPQALTLIWNPAVGSASYRIQLATDTGFAALVVDDSTLLATSRTVNSLAVNTRYYWRVRSKNLAGASAYSPRQYFTTITVPQPPPAPVLASPATGSINQPFSGSLRWRVIAGASSYHVQLAGDSLFGALLLNDSTIVDTSRLYSGLAPYARYFWRVRAKNTAGYGGYSASWNFRSALIPPAAPSLVAPSDNAADQPTVLTLLWSRQPYAEHYHVQIATDSLFSAMLVSDSTLTDSLKNVSGLPYNRLIYWRVRAFNSVGSSGYTSARKFATSSLMHIGSSVVAGWNLVSLPVAVGDARVTTLYPHAVSTLFSFDPFGGYAARDTLRQGAGYWIKYNAPDSVHVSGIVFAGDSIAVVPGWNLIGPFSTPVSVGSIQAVPVGILASGYFSYQGSYQQVFSLEPGAGYWIKIAAAGHLVIPSNQLPRFPAKEQRREDPGFE